ncbi:MAG: acyl-CoA desaturase, partial [Bacteroidota bacterium]
GAFARDIRLGMKEYFKSTQSRQGGAAMIRKSLFMLALYLIPLAILIFGAPLETRYVFALYLISGLGMAGVGMNIMHDALHGSYSHIPWLNKLMSYSINLIGASASVWKIQHNVLHHTYTNVAGADDDLNTNFLLRFSPDKPWHSIHKFQFIYAWLMYGMMTMQWVTVRDFVRMKQYRKMGFYEKPYEYQKKFMVTLMWKVIYFGFSLVLPMVMLAQPWWIVLLAFLSMHFITGSIISIVFETAHITPSAEYPQPDKDGNIDDHWYVHQLVTTCNFAPKGRLFSWCIGGLNYQIEHHLMPNVSHVHYRGLSKMVRDTAEKHGLPYYTHRTFADAVKAHLQKLKDLGQPAADPNYSQSTQATGLGALMKL